MAQNADVYLAHFLKFGKVTDLEDGPITGNPGERITSHSIDIPRGLRLTTSPASIIPGHSVRRDDLTVQSRNIGALFIREPENGNPALVARVRFPSEAGLNQGGRHYTQMTAAFITQSDWQSMAPAILLGGFDNIDAKADTLQELSDKGESRPKLPLAKQMPRPPSSESLTSLWMVINALASTGSFRADSSRFRDKQDFFGMLSLLVQLRPQQIASENGLVFATGLTARSRLADISFGEGETDTSEGEPADCAQFARVFGQPSNWDKLKADCARNLAHPVFGDRKENIRRHFQQIVEICHRGMKPSTERQARQAHTPTPHAEPSRQDQRIPPAASLLTRSTGTPRAHQETTGDMHRAPAMFSEASGIPLLDEVSEYSRRVSKAGDIAPGPDTSVWIPTIEEAKRAIAGERVAMDRPMPTTPENYWVSISQDGLRQLDEWLDKPGTNDPGLRQSLERFASYHYWLFEDEIKRMRRYSRIDHLLNTHSGQHFDTMRARSAEMQKLYPSSRERWAKSVVECLVCRLKRGVQLPPAESVRTALDALHYLSNSSREHLRQALNSAQPAPAATPSDIRSFTFERYRIEKILGLATGLAKERAEGPARRF